MDEEIKKIESCNIKKEENAKLNKLITEKNAIERYIQILKQKARDIEIEKKYVKQDSVEGLQLRKQNILSKIEKQTKFKECILKQIREKFYL